MTHKVIIIGSGAAGYSAAIYAARAGLKPLLFAGSQPGGQLTITTDVENYPGFADPIQGPWLMEQMKQQALNVECEIKAESVVEADLKQRPFTLKTDKETYQSQTVIIATGAQAKWLNIPGELAFQGHGVSACATCDGFFFKNQTVGVVGGGNTAVEEALFLTHHAAKVILIHRRDSLRAEKIMQQRLLEHPKVEVMWNQQVAEIKGDDGLGALPPAMTHIILENTQDQSQQELKLDGLFIAIGHAPSTELFKGQLPMDDHGYLKHHPDSSKTDIEGVFAAGDVSDPIYRQAVTAAGTGCMAALDAEKYLNL